MKSSKLWICAVAFAWAQACHTNVTRSTDGNTSWLGHCRTSAQCKHGLECLCGVCTSSCTEDATCSRHASASVCAGPTSSAFAATCATGAAADDKGVCLASCGAMGCGAGQACVDGACAPSDAPEIDGGADGGSNASMNPGTASGGAPMDPSTGSGGAPMNPGTANGGAGGATNAREGGSPTEKPVLSGPTAFEVSGDGFPRFIVYFQDSSAESAIVGNLNVSQPKLTRDADGTLVTGSFQLYSESLPRTYILVSRLSFQLRDSNGDGVADGLTGRIVGQDPQNGNFDSTVVGAVDRTAPTLSAADDTQAVVVDAAHPHNVLDELSIVSSEPLPANTTLSLDGSGVSFPLTSAPYATSDPALGDFVYSYRLLPAPVLLPFGAHFTVHVSPRLVDLAGNASAREFTVDTILAPPTFPEDGFESGVSGVLYGGARVVSRGETSTVPINGERSLLLPRGSRATLVLHLDTGDRTVRFQRLGAGQNATVTVAATGKTDRASLPLVPNSNPPPPTAGEFSISLPSSFQSAVDSVVVDINNDLPCYYADSDCGVADFVIDDLVADDGPAAPAPPGHP